MINTLSVSGAITSIGIFDYGTGGLSLLKALRAELPCENLIYIAGMATRGTLASARFAALLAAHSRQTHFPLLPCDGLRWFAMAWLKPWNNQFSSNMLLN